MVGVVAIATVATVHLGLRMAYVRKDGTQTRLRVLHTTQSAERKPEDTVISISTSACRCRVRMLAYALTLRPTAQWKQTPIPACVPQAGVGTIVTLHWATACGTATRVSTAHATALRARATLATAALVGKAIIV